MLIVLLWNQLELGSIDFAISVAVWRGTEINAFSHFNNLIFFFILCLPGSEGFMS